MLSDYTSKNPTTPAPKAAPAAAGTSPNSTVPNLNYKPRGEATAFASDKYDVSNLSYPDNLMSDTGEYGGNYVIFYINVSEDSKLLNDTRFAVVTDPSAIPVRQRGDAVAMNTTQAQFIGMGAVGGAALGSVGAAVGVGGAGAGAAIGGITGAALATQAASFTRKQKRLKQAIALYVPEDVSIKYGMNWSETETAAAAALQTGAAFIGKALEDNSSAGNQAGNAAKTAAAYAALKAPGTGDLASNITGLATNPKKEQIFKGVDFRTFQFNYKFFPRSSGEAANVLAIVNSFKLHMHPEFKDEFNFLYIYPSEFDVFYYQGGKENLNLHRHTSCVLTDMTVNYTPNGIFTTFPDGMPTQINITLSFKELALLTKANILDGF